MAALPPAGASDDGRPTARTGTEFITWYRVDPLGAGGARDWVIVKQQDFGPAR